MEKINQLKYLILKCHKRWPNDDFAISNTFMSFRLMPLYRKHKKEIDEYIKKLRGQNE